jgi:hypothetical protein
VHVTAGPLSRRTRAAGFSLLEVVIAAGLLLLTVTSVTAAVASVSLSGRRAAATMKADGVLESVISDLASLPFCAAALPAAPAADHTAATDFLAAVFPDAGAPRNTAAARYLPTDEDGVPGGSFVTRFDQEGVQVTCVARFRRQAGGAWMGPADLSGWDLAASVRLPAPVLVVDVVATAGGAHRTGRLVRVAGVDAVPHPLPAPSVGS